MGHCSTADDDRHDDPDLSHVQPETGDSEVCDENDQFGLPEPREYDRPYFDIVDYLSDEYADARNLNEAIDIRGQKAFAQNVTPDDFGDASLNGMAKVGIAELWAESRWNDGRSTRNIALEQFTADIHEGDMLEIRRCPEEISPWGYSFHRVDDDITLPYTPYHDFDDRFLSRMLDDLSENERLICQVRDTTCYGEDGIDIDPSFHWRVYTCKVTVYRQNLPESRKD
ncbi:hypothetical protein [uncultured Bifidobacterium sp.]|uniref:hypothetical protein n=1 Tax=uncultured Bifidobacterium sp. TaxID=165187 RepID=UPI002597AFDA|nr:hypothetical protein [uncultured Bifidobacterium sp.]